MHDNNDFDADRLIKENVELIKRIRERKPAVNSELLKSISTPEHLEEVFEKGHTCKQ